MTKISEERRAKLWNWCGLHFSMDDGSWFTPKRENTLLIAPPRATLNSLFRWALPKLKELGYNLHVHVDVKKDRTKVVISDAFTTYQASDKVPEHAAFLAVEKVMEGRWIPKVQLENK